MKSPKTQTIVYWVTDMEGEGWIIGLHHLVIMLTHNWRGSLNFCRLKVLLIQFFPVALSGIFLLAYAKCNFASVCMYCFCN